METVPQNWACLSLRDGTGNQVLYLETGERIMESPGATWRENLGWVFQNG